MDNKNGEFLKGMPLGDWLADRLYEWRAPFSEPSALNILLRNLAISFVGSLERALGRALYVKKSLGEDDRVPRRFWGLVSKCAESGIVAGVSYPQPIPEWPRIPVVVINNKDGVDSSGYELSYDRAFTKAIAENLERQSLLEWDEKKLVHGSWSELKSRGALDPRIFSILSGVGPAGRELLSAKVDEHTRLSWAPCFSLGGGRAGLIPAQLVYFRIARVKEEPLIQQATSNGAAAGASYEMALYNALCEAVERDALMIGWLNGLSPRRINLESISRLGNEKINAVLAMYRQYGIDFALLDISGDLGVPVYMTAVRMGVGGWPSIYISPRADLDTESAIVSSLLDGLRAGYGGELGAEVIKEAAGRDFIIDTHEKRRAYWALPGLGKKAEFLFGGEEAAAPKNEFGNSSPAVKLKKVKELLRARRIETYIIDVTHPVAQDAGLAVLKTLSPQLYPFYLNERFRYSGASRLYDVPVKTGKLSKPKKAEELNPCPHPML